MRTQAPAIWAIRGAGFGIVAGVVFALFEMVAAWAMGDGFWMPLRMIGAIVLGQGALDASYSVVGAAAAGAILHMALSALYGAIFGVIVGLAPALQEGRAVLVAAASLYGLALWLVNFYVVAPVAFEWFQEADTLVQFVAHTFFFGSLLGVLLAPYAAHAAATRRRHEPLRA